MSLFIFILTSIFLILLTSYLLYFIFTYEKKDRTREFEKVIKKRNLRFETPLKSTEKSFTLEEKEKTRNIALQKLEEKDKIPEILAGKSRKESKEEKKIKDLGDSNPRLLAQIFREILEEDPEWKMLKKEQSK